MTQLKSFSKRVELAGVRLLNGSEKKVRKSIRKTCVDIINQTPVDTGRLKNNWYSSNRQPINRTTKATDPTGKISIARLDKVLAKFKLGQIFYFVNNLPYLTVVEYGRYPNPPKNPTGKTVNGFSKQAPKGMVRINMQKMRRRLKERAR